MTALSGIAQGMVPSIMRASGLSVVTAATTVWDYVGELTVIGRDLRL